jgi:hypothetical protein
MDGVITKQKTGLQRQNSIQLWIEQSVERADYMPEYQRMKKSCIYLSSHWSGDRQIRICHWLAAFTNRLPRFHCNPALGQNPSPEALPKVPGQDVLFEDP